MPKRISDVSLHVYVTTETLERVVDTVREVVDDHLLDRDVFAWRFTLPVDTEAPEHVLLETRWRIDHPGEAPGTRRTYEIALSLVATTTELTEADVALLEQELTLRISAQPGSAVNWALRSEHRITYELDTNRERI